MGFGTKTNFVHKDSTAPGLYRIKSVFETPKIYSNVSTTFGESHEVFLCRFKNIFNRMLKKVEAPGPGSY